MKTSLLLLGLALGAGVIGTAQATDTATGPNLPNVGTPTFAAASTGGNGLLSDLGNLLSGHQGKTDTTTTDNGSTATTHVDQGYPHQPGPTSTDSGHAARRDTRARDNSAAPVVIRHAGGSAPADASSDTPPTLGWQSLLPGSIQ